MDLTNYHEFAKVFLAKNTLFNTDIAKSLNFAKVYLAIRIFVNLPKFTPTKSSLHTALHFKVAKSYLQTEDQSTSLYHMTLPTKQGI